MEKYATWKDFDDDIQSHLEVQNVNTFYTFTLPAIAPDKSFETLRSNITEEQLIEILGVALGLGYAKRLQLRKTREIQATPAAQLSLPVAHPSPVVATVHPNPNQVPKTIDISQGVMMYTLALESWFAKYPHLGDAEKISLGMQNIRTEDRNAILLLPSNDVVKNSWDHFKVWLNKQHGITQAKDANDCRHEMHTFKCDSTQSPLQYLNHMVMLSYKLKTLNPSDSLPNSRELIDLVIAGIGKGHPDIEVALVGFMTTIHSWNEFESFARNLCSRREEQLQRNLPPSSKQGDHDKKPDPHSYYGQGFKMHQRPGFPPQQEIPVKDKRNKGFKKEGGQKQFFCEFHQENNSHDTSNCRTIKKLVEVEHKRRQDDKEQTFQGQKNYPKGNKNTPPGKKPDFQQKKTPDRDHKRRYQAGAALERQEDQCEDTEEEGNFEFLQSNDNSKDKELAGSAFSLKASTTETQFGKIIFLDCGTNTKLLSRSWANKPEIDLFGLHDGVPKCEWEANNSKIATVGGNVKAPLRVSFEVVYMAKDAKTKKSERIVHVFQNVQVTDQNNETPLLLDVHSFRESESMNPKTGEMVMVSPITKRSLILPWKVHPETKLWYMPFDSIRKPRVKTVEEAKEKRWQTTNTKPHLISNLGKQGLKSSNQQKTTSDPPRRSSRIQAQQHVPAAVQTKNRFTVLSDDQTVSEKQGNGVSPLPSGGLYNTIPPPPPPQQTQLQNQRPNFLFPPPLYCQQQYPTLHQTTHYAAHCLLPQRGATKGTKWGASFKGIKKVRELLGQGKERKVTWGLAKGINW